MILSKKEKAEALAERGHYPIYPSEASASSLFRELCKKMLTEIENAVNFTPNREQFMFDTTLDATIERLIKIREGLKEQGEEQ